jgi:glucose-1-phosphate cytidylyltransferase
MKVVLFCGGLGMRMREYSENVPKPMVPIGYRPILWHIMKYYAHYGHKDFILCLGYKGDVIKDYFLNYRETLTNDFVLTKGGKQVDLVTSDIDEWSITFAETGLHSNIGMRLKAVQPYLQGEEAFLAHYSDILTDLDMNAYIDGFMARDKIGSFVAAKPPVSFHTVQVENDGLVTSILPAEQDELWQNGGFFVLRQAIFDYIQPGEELVVEPFQRLIAAQQLVSHKHHGFWSSMDTYKEMQTLNDIYTAGKAPWEIWKKPLLEQTRS